MPKYSKTGPPFDFLGHLSESQKKEFYKWIDKRKPNFVDIEKWWRIRAHQLRKTAGILEKWYKEKNDEPLKTRWEKKTWEPGGDGHFLYINRDDKLPGLTVAEIKELFKEQLQRDDEGMFQMGHLRTVIEKAEDQAQRANEATGRVPQLTSELDRYFGQPEYQAVLVKDLSDLYKGQPRFRISQMDEPTIWEKEQASSMSEKIQIKEST